MTIPERNVYSTGGHVLSIPNFNNSHNAKVELVEETISKSDRNVTTDSRDCLQKANNKLEQPNLPLSKRSNSKRIIVLLLSSLFMFIGHFSPSTASEPFTNCTNENTFCVNREEMRHLSNGGVIFRDTGQIQMRIQMEHGRLVFHVVILRYDQRSANSRNGDDRNDESNDDETSYVSENTQEVQPNTLDIPTTVPAADILVVSGQIHDRSVMNGNSSSEVNEVDTVNEVGTVGCLQDEAEDEQRKNETEGSLVPNHQLFISNQPISFQNQHMVNGPSLNDDVTESSEECQRNISADGQDVLVITGQHLVDNDNSQFSTLDIYHRQPSGENMDQHHRILISGHRVSPALQPQDSQLYVDNEEVSIDNTSNICGLSSGHRESHGMEWHGFDQHHKMLISGRRESYALQEQDHNQQHVDNVELPIEDTSNSPGTLVITGQNFPVDERECDAGVGHIARDRTHTAVSLYHPTDEYNEGFSGRHGQLVVTHRYRQPVITADAHRLLVTNRSPGMDPYCPANRATIAEIAVSGHSQVPNPIISGIYSNPQRGDNLNAPVARPENGSDISGVCMD